MSLSDRAGTAVFYGEWGRDNQSAPMVRSATLLRFVAGVRALLAFLAGVVLLARGIGNPPMLAWVVLPYLLLAGALQIQALRGSTSAVSRHWLWVDAAVLVLLCDVLSHEFPWLDVLVVVPVIATSLLAGLHPAIAMSLAIGAAMVVSGEWAWSPDRWPALPITVPMAVLAFAPAAVLLARPTRALVERLQLTQSFKQRSDPRQGLLHHVEVLLELLLSRYDATSAVVNLQGPQPRVFLRNAEATTLLLDEAAAAVWRARRQALPDDVGCLCSATEDPRVTAFSLGPSGNSRTRLDDGARRALLEIGPHSLALPLMSYGRPLGHLCISREQAPFTVSDLRCLDEAMRELLPLLERSDLLEQLQLETAAAERERIGRDLHDSAVQPYLGLKYGLEALARQADPANPLAPNLRQLIMLTTQELEALRDVVSGLRHGKDPMAAGAFTSTLQRQALRFEALYGLKVSISAPDGLRLRGSIAKAVLHMINEALTNVRRHTAAREVGVVLDLDDDAVVVRVRNDHGPRRPQAPVRVEQFTPRSLRDRAIQLGGSIALNIETDCTEIVITLPWTGALG